MLKHEYGMTGVFTEDEQPLLGANLDLLRHPAGSSKFAMASHEPSAAIELGHYSPPPTSRGTAPLPGAVPFATRSRPTHAREHDLVNA